MNFRLIILLGLCFGFIPDQSFCEHGSKPNPAHRRENTSDGISFDLSQLPKKPKDLKEFIQELSKEDKMRLLEKLDKKMEEGSNDSEVSAHLHLAAFLGRYGEELSQFNEKTLSELKSGFIQDTENPQKSEREKKDARGALVAINLILDQRAKELGSVSGYLASVANNNENWAITRILAGTAVGPAALFDTLPRAIKQSGVEARREINKTLEEKKDPVTQVAGQVAKAATHVGEVFAQGANGVGAAAPLIAGSAQSTAVAATLSHPVTVQTVRSLGAVAGTVNAVDTLKRGTFSGSDALGLIAPLVGGGRAPVDSRLTKIRIDPWRGDFGKPSEGLGQLVRDLPKGDPARQDLARMIRDIRTTNSELMNGRTLRVVSTKGLSPNEHAAFTPLGNTAKFQYSTERLRIVDLLEEQVHWGQIRSGQHDRLRSYFLQQGMSENSASEKVKQVLETLAKQRVIQHPQITPTLKKEWKWDLQRVKSGNY